MGFFVGALEALGGDVGIDLRRGQVGVAQQLRTLRKSAPASRMWVAKLCRSLCGVRFGSRPARRRYFLSRNCTVRGESGRMFFALAQKTGISAAGE